MTNADDIRYIKWFFPVIVTYKVIIIFSVEIVDGNELLDVNLQHCSIGE
jgi:hypothetical protein